MQPRTLWLATLAALRAVTAGAGESTDLPPPTGSGVERGVVILRCNAPSGTYWTSRATVVDIGAGARADVLLTTAHGLRSVVSEVVEHCKIVVRGKEHDIEQVWNAGSLGPADDWAVLLTQRIAGDVGRWHVAQPVTSWLDALVADNSQVRLVLRYAGAGQSDCRLEGWTAQGLLAHTCVSYPGSSGSPLVVGIDRAPVLIAVHVGSELRWDGRLLDMTSVARPIDAPVIAAIEAAALQATAVKRRR